jgi:hypothetical protein
MDFVPAVAMLALVVKVIDFLRYTTNRDVNGVVTQLITWAAGIAAVTLVAHTTWANGIVVGGTALAKLGFWSQFFAGLSIASGASVVKDTLKAVDNHNTAAIPTLLPPGPTPTRPQPGRLTE